MAFPPRFGMPPISPAAFVSAYQTMPMVSILPATHYIVPTIPNPVIATAATKTPSRRRELPIEKPPVTTVFVGNIHDHASNELIKGMLMKCGNIMQWKRIQGSNGKFQAFGFCEYDHPDSTLRALRLLHDWPLGDKRLVLKVDEKTKETLIEFINKRRQLYGKAPLKFEGDRVPGDEEMRKEDEVYRNALEGLVKEQGEELFEGSSADKPPSQKSPTLSGKGGNLDIESLDRDKKEYIAKEIIMFREAHKDDKELKPKVRPSSTAAMGDKEGAEKADGGAATKPGHAVDRGREGSVVSSSTSKAERRVSRKRKSSTSSHRSSSVESKKSSTRRHHRRGNSRESPDRSIVIVNRRRATRSRSRSKSRNSEDAEELYERRRLERKVREKETAYEERLRKWEGRERKKEKEREKLRAKLRQAKKEEAKEAKKLKEFLEDYDDERDDPKYYKSKALELRRRDYENELEMDLLDQQKEKEELNEIRGKLFANGFANPEEEIRRMEEARGLLASNMEHRSPSWSSPKRSRSSDEGSAHSAEAAAPASSPTSPLKEKKEKKEAVLDPTTFVPADADGGNRPLGFTGLKLGVGGSSSSNLRKVFNEENEDETEENAPSRPLVPLEYTEEEKRAVEESRLTAEEKKKMIKSLIEKIPTSKDELFKYTIDWTYVDQNLIEKRLKPWVVKKIVEYIGEEEPSLVDFICQKVDEKASPQSILDDVSMVLDEEASVFVVKLWRLLIYEIEAKKIGIVKGDSQG